MTKQVEFFYDYGSPTCYLAWTQLPGLCASHGASLVRKPILLGGVFKATGNKTPASIPAKGAWMFVDIERYAKLYGAPFLKNPNFIFNTLLPMRGAIWANSSGVLESYDKAVFEAAWTHGCNISDPDELKAIIASAGIDTTDFAQGVQSDDIKKALIAETNRAVERGVFGAPTMFVDGEMYFGQDRLPWIERALGAADFRAFL
jgi:2-hydroxychromene-2-carboxylate isomerase